jgi:hypothetical protein
MILASSKAGAAARASFMIATKGKAPRISDVVADGQGWSVVRWETGDAVDGRCVCKVELTLPKKNGYTRSTLTFFSEPGRMLDRVELSSLVTLNSDSTTDAQ